MFTYSEKSRFIVLLAVKSCSYVFPWYEINNITKQPKEENSLFLSVRILRNFGTKNSFKHVLRLESTKFSRI